MATAMVMPKWGMTMQEGTVGAWLKSEGDTVAEGEEIVEIESDKAVHLVEAPASGVLARILVEAGNTVAVATPIAVITDEGEEVPADLLIPAADVTAPSSPAPTPATPAPRQPTRPSRPGGRIPATPAAKRMAREHGVDLATVAATGPDGLVRVEDIEEAIAAMTRATGPVTRVAFHCRGCRLQGRLYLPESRFAGNGDDTSRLPGVVIALGYTYTQDLLVPEMARQLAAEDRAVLIFDYRGFGKSEGDGEAVRPWDQVDDVRAAVSFLLGRDEVDADRVAVLGISMGGSHAVTVAAIDPRVAAAVAISPAGDAARLMQVARSEDEWAEWLARIDSDRIARAQGRPAEMVDAWEIIRPDPDSRGFLDQLYTDYPDLACRLSLETAAAMLGYSPEGHAHGIGERPVLLIHGADDRLVPPSESRALQEAIGDSAQLELIPGVAHFDWANPADSRYEQIVATVNDWLGKVFPT